MIHVDDGTATTSQIRTVRIGESIIVVDHCSGLSGSTTGGDDLEYLLDSFSDDHWYFDVIKSIKESVRILFSVAEMFADVKKLELHRIGKCYRRWWAISMEHGKCANTNKLALLMGLLRFGFNACWWQHYGVHRLGKLILSNRLKSSKSAGWRMVNAT